MVIGEAGVNSKIPIQSLNLPGETFSIQVAMISRLGVSDTSITTTPECQNLAIFVQYARVDSACQDLCHWNLNVLDLSRDWLIGSISMTPL